MPATAKALLAAASRSDRTDGAALVRTAKAERSTAEAQAMGITGVVGSYHTTYGGIANRLHNVALVAQLIDGALIAPGKTFSFNETTGERTAEKGFLEAPVIINGELQTGLGGGVCQVSTTVFNAAYEAGLPIDERTNHALYISHYPLGRDATVNYPDLDLKFTNDTGKWLLLRTFVGSGSLTVNLYGTPQDRRVESIEQPLRVVGRRRGAARQDPTMEKGTSEIVEYGQPARTTARHPHRLRRRAARCSTRTRGTRPTAPSRRSSASGTKPKPMPKPSRSPRRPRPTRPARPRPTPAATPPPTERLRLGRSDRLDEPRRDARRPARHRVDRRVRRRAFGDELVAAARPRTRSGSARRGRRRSASRSGGGRRSRPARW